MTKITRHLAAARDVVRKLLRRGPLPEQGTDPDPSLPPDDLRFELGHFPFVRDARYRIKNGWIHLAVRHSWQVRERWSFLKRRPAAEDWLEFWRAVGPLHIWDWKPSYFTPPRFLPFVIDGPSWRFSCRSGTRRVKSFGGSYYPKLWRPLETNSRRDAIALLKAALDELLSPDPANKQKPDSRRA